MTHEPHGGYVCGRIGDFYIIEGVATRGGEFGARRYRGPITWFTCRADAERHAYLETPWLNGVEATP